MELAANFGLSPAEIKRNYRYNVKTDFTYLLTTDWSNFSAAIAKDNTLISTSTRSLPCFTSVSRDIVNNAFPYGKMMTFFDETAFDNTHAAPSAAYALTPAEAALRAKVVVATGAYSYITSQTLDRIVTTWQRASPPVFILFPLIGTDMSAIIGHLKVRGMDVYHEPALHWLPLRQFKDESEAGVMECFEDSMLSAAGAPTPIGAKPWYMHASPLVAGPTGMGLRDVAKKWIEGDGESTAAQVG